MNNKTKNFILGTAVAMSVPMGASMLEAAPLMQDMSAQNNTAYVQQVDSPSSTQIDLGSKMFDSKYFESAEYQNSIKGVQFDDATLKKAPFLKEWQGMIPIAVAKTSGDKNLNGADGYTDITNGSSSNRFFKRTDELNGRFASGEWKPMSVGHLAMRIVHNKSAIAFAAEAINQKAWREGGFGVAVKFKPSLDGKTGSYSIERGEHYNPHSDFRDYKPLALNDQEYKNFKSVFPEGLTMRNAALVPYFAQSYCDFNSYTLEKLPDITDKEFAAIRSINPRFCADNGEISKQLRNQFNNGIKQVSFEASSKLPKVEFMSAIGQTTHDETIHIPAFRGKDQYNAATGARIAAVMQLKQEGKTGYVDKVTCLGPNGDGTYKFDVSCKVYDTPNAAIKNMAFEKDGLEKSDGVRNVSFWKDGVKGPFDNDKPLTVSEIDQAVTSLDKSDLERLESLQAHQKAKEMLPVSESVEKGPAGLNDFTFVPGLNDRGTAQLEYIIPGDSAAHTEKDAADYGLSATKDYLGSQGRLTSESSISVKDVSRLGDGDFAVAVDATNVVPGISKSVDLEDVKGSKVPEPFSIKDIMAKTDDLVKSTKDLASAKVNEKIAGVALNEHMNTYVNGGNSFFDKIKTKMAVMSEFGSTEKLNEQTNKLSDRAAESVRNTAKASQAFDKSVDSLRQSVADTCNNDPKVMRSFEKFASDANAFKYAVNEGTDKNTRSAEKHMKESYKNLQGEIKGYGKSYELDREAINRDNEISKAPSMIRSGMSDKEVYRVLVNKEMSGGTTSLREAEKIVIPDLVKRFGNDGKGHIDVEKGIQRTTSAINGASSNYINKDSKQEVHKAAKGLESISNVKNRANSNVNSAKRVKSEENTL